MIICSLLTHDRLTTNRMYSPKKILLRELLLTKSLSGTPRTSMIQESCSCSFSPGKIGNPVYNSAKMQPKLQISMAI